MRRLGCVLAGFAFLLCLATTSWGQTQITSGTVQGDVSDEKGGSVGDASVEIKNLDTNFTRTGMTGADGHFAFLLLSPGRYTLTVTKQGFATIVQENINLTVGQALSLPITMKVSATSERIVVTATPAVEVTTTQSSTTINEISVSKTPMLGRKFEDLLTLTPGVSIVQGPDGDEINFNGQRGVYNNISLDGGDYNNTFFGEQLGGQRAAIDIPLDAVKEFQVVASGASAEYGRTAGGIVNVITKSGTNELHGSLFYFQRLEALAADTSDGKPLKDFHREQFGGTIGGPIVKDKLFFFGSAEGIRENLNRDNMSEPIGTCPVANPVFNNGSITDAQVAANGECQRLVLLDFFQNPPYSPTSSGLGAPTNEGLPVNHTVRNGAALGRVDWILNASNQISGTYNFDWSKNTNQTFDVATYGTSANGIEGPSKIQTVNLNWFTTISPTKLNEAHFTYGRENRPRDTIDRTSVPDTGMGFGPSFRFGQPYFLQPNVDELYWRMQIRDSFSLIRGKHTFKFGGEWIHTNNSQIFRGFFNGRYIFDSVTGFLHYASPASLGPGFGPGTVECSNGTFGDIVAGCSGGATVVGGPLLLYLQHGPASAGQTPDESGASSINNEEPAFFVQDTWQIWRGFTLNYGLRWEAQMFPDPVVPPSQTSYGPNLSDPAFPSDGTIPDANKLFQPRIGFAWDVTGKGKSKLRASWGIYNARQNMLAQVGSITTNGVQQQSIAAGTFFNTAGGPPPTYPGLVPVAPLPPGTPAAFAGVTIFPRDYANPRIYTTNVAYEQELMRDLAAYVDFTWAKGVHLTREINPNVGVSPTFNCGPNATNVSPGVCVPNNGDTVTYPSTVFGSGVAPPFPNLGDITDTVSSAKSLYRGVSFGIRKRFSSRFQMEGNYTYSVDKDDDSNERDPFTFRYANLFNLAAEYSNSDRDNRHRFNFYTYAELPYGFTGSIRMQAHSAQPITVNVLGDGSGAPCSINNSRTRFVNGIDCGRNHLRKNNEYFSLDWRLERPFKIGERMKIIPMAEMFNTFNNDNNVNPLISPALFNFDGFLRNGVGDPRQLQLAIRFTF